jgi:cytochrome b6-f complex iron-sulfur subunit
MNRREFIEKACLGSLGTIVGMSVLSALDIPSIQAFAKPSPSGGKDIPLRLEDTPELKEVGGAYHLTVEDPDKELLIVRLEEEKFIAVDIKCTHKGCDVKYDDKSTMFVCPCHDSKFDLNGVPKSGPAKKPLGVYKTSFKDGEVTIHLPDEDEARDARHDTTIMKMDPIVTDTTKKK